MKTITFEEMANYLETANVLDSHDFGHQIVHVGINADGQRFVMLNSPFETVLGEFAA